MPLGSLGVGTEAQSTGDSGVPLRGGGVTKGRTQLEVGKGKGAFPPLCPIMEGDGQPQTP